MTLALGEPVPELKAALLIRALPSLVLTAKVCVGLGEIPQTELVKLAEPQPFRAIFQSNGQRVALPWQEAEPKCLLTFLGSWLVPDISQGRAGLGHE